jgi:hypothetical protein
MKQELIDLLECLPIEIFWLWVSKWYDVDNIYNCINTWDDEIIKEEIEFIKSLIK